MLLGIRAEHVPDLLVVDLDICKGNLKFSFSFWFFEGDLFEKFLDDEIADSLIVIFLVFDDLEELVWFLVAEDCVCFSCSSHSIGKKRGIIPIQHMFHITLKSLLKNLQVLHLLVVNPIIVKQFLAPSKTIIMILDFHNISFNFHYLLKLSQFWIMAH